MAGNLRNIRSDVFIEKLTETQVVNNSTTVVDDSHLFFSIAPYEYWDFEVILKIATTAVADFKACFSVPAGASMDQAAASIVAASYAWNAATGENSITFITDQTNGRGRYFGMVRNGATAGLVVFRWAQSTAEVSNTKVLIGSYMKLRRIK